MLNDRDIPKKVVREELGGDYYYRCGWLACNQIVRSDWDYCPYCGTKLDFQIDDFKRFWSNAARYCK